MAADGSVVIEARMNTSQAEKDLAKLKGKIEKAEEELNNTQSKRDEASQNQTKTGESLKEAQEKLKTLKEELNNLQEAKIAGDNLEKAKANAQKIGASISELQERLSGAESLRNSQRSALDEENAKLKEMKDTLLELRYASKNTELSKEQRNYAKSQIPIAQAEIAEQQQRVRALQSEWKKSENSVARYKNKLDEASRALASQITEIEKMEASGAAPVSAEQLNSARQQVAEQQSAVNGLQSEWNRAHNAVEKYDRQIEDATGKIERQKEEAGKLESRLDEARTPVGKMSKAFDGSSESLDKLGKRISGLAKRVFIFTLITQALRTFRTYLSKVLKTNDEAQAAFARLKGALLTLAQPIIELLIPALTTLANILTVIVSAIASLVSGLFGKTAKQSANAAKNLYGEAEAIEGVGSAAEEATGSLAGFDEINAINTDAGSTGAGAGAADIMPDFTLDSGISDRLKEIADLVMLIAAGLALWKLGTLLPGVLGQIFTILGGILMTVGGLLLAWHGLSDAWENGVNWGNLIESIAGVAAAALGLYLVFGKIGAGIGLIVGGIALLVTAFHDAMENGWNLQNTLMAIAGIMGTGLGISIITGSFIPLLIAGIASLLLAFTIATGHGEELLDGIRTVLDGFRDFFKGVFSGDLTLTIAGITKIFTGLGKMVLSVIAGLRDTLLSFLDWLDEKTGGKLHGIIEFVKGLINGAFKTFTETAMRTIQSLMQIFTGLTKFISGVFTGDWDRAWEGIKDIFKGVWNGILGFLSGAVNLIIQGVNWIIKQLNKINFKVPDWVPGIGGKGWGGFNIQPVQEWHPPMLAQGAVIPPNREFMAVLGDQKHGTNVEAPLETIKQALIEALRESGNSGGGDINVTLELDGTVLARKMVKRVNDMTRQAGRPVLLY